MDDPPRSGEGGPVPGATASLVEWTSASTERVLGAFLSSVMQDLTRTPPSKSEVVNFTAISEEFLATSSTTGKTHTLPAFFTRPEAPDILAVAVEGSWAVVAIAALLIGRCSTTTPRGATSAPTLLYAHGVRTLTLLLLTLIQLGALGEAGLRNFHSHAPHVLLLPAHALALGTTLLLWILYHHLEAWHCESGVGVGVGVWACGACVGGVRAWQAVGVGGVPFLLVYPTISLASGLLQLFLCCLDAAALCHWVSQGKKDGELGQAWAWRREARKSLPEGRLVRKRGKGWGGKVRGDSQGRCCKRNTGKYLSSK